MSWGTLSGIISVEGVPLGAQETIVYLLPQLVTRARASSEEEGVLQSQQEPLREVMEPACRTDQVSVSPAALQPCQLSPFTQTPSQCLQHMLLPPPCPPFPSALLHLCHHFQPHHSIHFASIISSSLTVPITSIIFSSITVCINAIFSKLTP